MPKKIFKYPMENSNTKDIYSKYLKVFDSYFDGEKSNIIETTEIFGSDALVNISKNKEGGVVDVNYSFVPYMMEHLKQTAILQIFSQIHQPEYDGGNAEINRIISEINKVTTIGTFSHANNNIYFKYMFFFPLGQIPDKEAFLEVHKTFLINFNYFGKMLKKSMDLSPLSIDEVKKALNID